MSYGIFLPIRLFGLAATGVAVGVAAWRIGTYLGEVAIGERESPWPRLAALFREKDESEPVSEHGHTVTPGASIP